MEPFDKSKIEGRSSDMLRKINDFNFEQINCENEEKRKFILEILELSHLREYHKASSGDLTEKNTQFQEQIEMKESELIEFEEGFMKEAFSEIENLKNGEKEFEIKLKESEQKLSETYFKVVKDIDHSMKIKNKMKEFPGMLEAVHEKNNTIMEVENCKLDSIKSMIEDCYYQEKNALNRMSSIEDEVNQDNMTIENLNDLIEKENEKAALVAKYNDNIIPLKKKDIKAMEEAILNAEKIIKEKYTIIDNTKMNIKELKINIQREQLKEESLLGNIQAMKQKRDFVKKKGIMVEELDNSLCDLISTMEYQKEKENIQKLKADKTQIANDVQNTKNYTEELQKELDQLKANDNDAVIMQLENQVESLNKSHKEKLAELESLKKENSEYTDAIEASKRKKDSLNTNIINVIGHYKKYSKSDHATKKKNKEVPLKKENLKPPEPSQNIDQEDETDSNSIEDWLEHLPKRFTRSSEKSQDSATSSGNDEDTRDKTIEYQEVTQISLATEKIESAESGDSSNRSICNKEFYLDIPDPDALDANMDYSMSDLTGNSEYWIDDSFLNLEN